MGSSSKQGAKAVEPYKKRIVPPDCNILVVFFRKMIYNKNRNKIQIKAWKGERAMKLIIAIVQDEDASRLVSNLMSEGYGVTKLATTGGFLRAGNTTLLVGVDDDKFDGAMKVIEHVCKSRKQIATSPSPIAGTSGVYVPYPVEVMVGGATIFVLNVEQFVKI